MYKTFGMYMVIFSFKVQVEQSWRCAGRVGYTAFVSLCTYHSAYAYYHRSTKQKTKYSKFITILEFGVR